MRDLNFRRASIERLGSVVVALWLAFVDGPLVHRLSLSLGPSLSLSLSLSLCNFPLSRKAGYDLG